MYILFSSRSGGWLTSGATYTTEVKDAWQLPRERALEIVAKHYNAEFGLGLIPVQVTDLPVEMPVIETLVRKP